MKLIVLLLCITISQTTTAQTGSLNKIDTGTKVLDTITVNSYRSGNGRTLSSAKTPISNFDLPQTVGAVNNTVNSDQQATRVGDIIKNVAGVSLTQTRLGVNETYTARGYSIGITCGAGSILKNGLVSNIAGMPEAAPLESVEVMMGSTALLYGNVSGGLIVNLLWAYNNV